jgi:hypothetical protein
MEGEIVPIAPRRQPMGADGDAWFLVVYDQRRRRFTNYGIIQGVAVAANSNAGTQIRCAGADDTGDAKNQYRDGNERFALPPPFAW